MGQWKMSMIENRELSFDINPLDNKKCCYTIASRRVKITSMKHKHVAYEPNSLN